MIHEFLEKRKVKKAFEKLVDPETVESLLRDGAQPQQLKQGRIEFVLAFVRGESPAPVSERIARVADLAVAHGAVHFKGNDEEAEAEKDEDMIRLGAG